MALLIPEQIHTKRLVLRKPQPSDAASIFDAYAQDAEVVRYMVWRPHTSASETEAFIAHCIDLWENGKSRPYVLANRDSEHIPIDMLEGRIFSYSIDIGYVLARHYWREGLMTEAVVEFSKAALLLAGCFRVQAVCDIENIASICTLEKSGFLREGRLDRYAMHPNISAQPRPCFMYARCK